MSAVKMTDEFRSEVVTIRGSEYTFRELSANEYDEIVKLATGPDDTAPLDAVLRLMVIKSVEPKINADDLGRKPYPVYRKLLSTVNDLHFALDAAEKNGKNGTEKSEAVVPND
jgi:hypothetical protein